MYTVHLTYFKPTGKYYSEASVMSAGPELFDIWGDVRTWMRTQCLPGLMAGHSEFIVLVEVPDHPNAHPHLMLPDGDAWEPEIKPAPPKFEPPGDTYARIIRKMDRGFAAGD